MGASIGAGAAQNHFNRRPEKSYGVLDLPHQFKVTMSYDLPFGRGKRFAQTVLLRHALGDWNFGTFLFYQSGFPMGVIDTGYARMIRMFTCTARGLLSTEESIATPCSVKA